MLTLIDNRPDGETLANHLSRLLETATAAFIHVAYLRESGVALVREAGEELPASQAERHRQADACLDSLSKFRDAKRKRLQLSILDYQRRLLAGEDMDIAIRRTQHELDRLDEDCDRRQREVASLVLVTV